MLQHLHIREQMIKIKKLKSTKVDASRNSDPQSSSSSIVTVFGWCGCRLLPSQQELCTHCQMATNGKKKFTITQEMLNYAPTDPIRRTACLGVITCSSGSPGVFPAQEQTPVSCPFPESNYSDVIASPQLVPESGTWPLQAKTETSTAWNNTEQLPEAASHCLERCSPSL